MQLFYKISRVCSLIAIAIVLTMSSCGTKKYGCPGHMFTPPAEMLP